MNIRAQRSLALLLFTAAAALPAAHAAAPFTIEDLVRIKRLSDPQVAPDGHSVAFVLRETDLDANRGRRALWLLDLKSTGAAPRRLTQDSADDWSPRWADGGRTLYLSLIHISEPTRRS